MAWKRQTRKRKQVNNFGQKKTGTSGHFSLHKYLILRFVVNQSFGGKQIICVADF